MGDYSGTIGRSFQNSVTQASIARIWVPKGENSRLMRVPCVKLGLFSHSGEMIVISPNLPRRILCW